MPSLVNMSDLWVYGILTTVQWDTQYYVCFLDEKNLESEAILSEWLRQSQSQILWPPNAFSKL